MSMSLGILTLGIFAICAFGLTCLFIKRRHDVGYDINSDPYFSPGLLENLLYIFLPSQKSKNKFGPLPKHGIDWKSIFLLK